MRKLKIEFKNNCGKELLKEWGIPDSFKGIGYVVLGYADMPTHKLLSRNKIIFILLNKILKGIV